MDSSMADLLCSYHTNLDTTRNDKKTFKYIMHKYGVKKVVSNKVATFFIDVSEIPGLEEIPSKITLAVPRIPFKFFTRTVEFFKQVMEQKNGAEAMVQFFFNKDKNSYIVYCPEQIVSGGHVSYTKNQELEEKYTLVAEIHSHNTMGAFFSSVDNGDEKRNMLFGVFGKLNKPQFEYQLRASVSGEYIPLTLFDLFESYATSSGFPNDLEIPAVLATKTREKALTTELPLWYTDYSDYKEQKISVSASSTYKKLKNENCSGQQILNTDTGKYESSTEFYGLPKCYGGVEVEEKVELDVDIYADDDGWLHLPEGFSIDMLHPDQYEEIIDWIVNCDMESLVSVIVEGGLEDTFQKECIRYCIENTLTPNEI